MFQILIADSDRAYRRRLYQLLRREGYSVLQASGGEDVLKVLETSYIDFIILGDNLVDLNVYELMGQLRDTYSDMPLMLLAEKKERDGLRKSYMAGADEYLTKNVDEEELVLRIRAVLRRSGKNYDKKLQVGDVKLHDVGLHHSRHEQNLFLHLPAPHIGKNGHNYAHIIHLF